MSNVVMENTYNFEIFDYRKYIIGEKIGEGSYGIVYKVVNLSSEDKDLYALKILKSGYSKKYIKNLIKYSTNNQENADNIYRNYRGRRPILHKYKIVYLDNILLPDGDIASGYATFSELATYGNLEQYLKSQELDFIERLEIVSSIIEGLQTLHSKAICHSALKAENILVFKNTNKEQNSNNKNKKMNIEISLSDFSVIPSFSERNIISPNEFYASYTSPNCIKFPTNGYTFEDDIYSLGLLLWQVVYNETPFQKELNEINHIKLTNAIDNRGQIQNLNIDGDYDPILPVNNDTSYEVPYEYKKKIEEKNKEMKLLESYNQIQQSTHYMVDNFKLSLNNNGRIEQHSQNNELLKLYNLIIEEQLRPGLSDNIPVFYRDLISNCWNAIPSKRPDLVKIDDTIQHLKNSGYKNKTISLNYNLTNRQSKSLSRCLENDKPTSYHYSDKKKEKTKSIWKKINPRNSIMKIFKSYNSNNKLRNNSSQYDSFNSPVSRTSLMNPLLFNGVQPDIEMENIEIPEQVGFNNIPIGHCENNYTTVNIESKNDSVIVDINYQDKPLPTITENGDTSYITNSDTTGINNISYLSTSIGVGDSLMENSIISTDTKSSDYYYDENDPNNRNYPDLVLDDIDFIKDEIDDEVVKEFEKLNINMNSYYINDPLNSKQVNKEYNKNDIIHELSFGGERDVNSNFSNTDTYSYSFSDEEDENTISNYKVAKNYINYNNNKRNTLFAFLEAKTSNNNENDIDNINFSSSEESVNFYDEEDVKQLTEKTISTNSIKEDLKNSGKGKESVSSPLSKDSSNQETTIINPFI
ncbi:kinase-like protein [Neocallimastix lanati (nom. inval.)]|jgi:serine/threonine protein kinase|nr:kinase-like protein [Neocallimastix sp. JGI-2020a]